VELRPVGHHQRDRVAVADTQRGQARRDLPHLADWLRAWPVPAVVMEATGDYWKGPFYRLEAEGFECVLADAKQVRHLPGRPKRDPSDSRWLAACLERGAITPCFVADPEFRVIRLHTRYRRDLIGERTREKQRAEKLLESAAVKLSSVVSDLHGMTGRDIMNHLIAGERDPKVLAQLARGRARAKISQLEAALDGAEFFTGHHAALLTVMLERTDRLAAEIAALTEVIELLLAPYEEQLAQAESMPGWGRRTGQDALAETGPDMTRFPPAPTWPPGPGASRWTTSPAPASDGQNPRKAAGTWPRSLARPPSRPAAPRPAKAPATGGWPAAAASSKPRSRSATPSRRSTTSCCPHQACGTRTSDRTTTSASATPAARSPTTSANSAPSASKSPSAASPDPAPKQTRQPDRTVNPSSGSADAPPDAAARPVTLQFSGQSFGKAFHLCIPPVHDAAAVAPDRAWNGRRRQAKV
jgi:transposase